MNREMVKVSVVVPVYNGERYIACALDSVLRQTLTDIEVICVNDGSSDETAAILDRYAVQDSRIKVIHRGNEGVSAARNAGIESASGRYVAFLDADDELEPEVYEKMLSMVEE